MLALRLNALRVIWLIIASFYATLAAASVPQILVRQDEEQFTLPLVDLQIRTTLVPPLARTEFFLTYKNERDENLEGEFLFPLPASATVVDIGLYFNDVLRHSAVVEREAARTAYDQIVARMTDPALAEWMSENVFSLEVYPIPARGEKKIYVAYEEEMSLASGQLEYFLDLNYKQRLKTFRFDLETQRDGMRIVTSAMNLFPSAPGQWSAQLYGVLLQDQVRVSYRLPKSDEGVLGSEEPDGSRYFCLALKTATKHAEQEPQSDVILFVDVSGSGSSQDDEKLFGFLADFLKAQQHRVDVTVVPFHQEIEDWFLVQDARSPSGFTKLKKQIAHLPRAGATNLAGLFDQMPEILGNLPRGGRIVLISDGLQTLSSSLKLWQAVENFAALRKPLLVVSATKSMSFSNLQKIARDTNGWFLDLLAFKKSQRAVEQAMSPPIHVGLHQADPSLQDLQLQQRGELVWIYGKALSSVIEPRSLVLRYGTDGADDYRSFQFKLEEHKDSGIVKRALGRAKLQEMLSTATARNEEFLNLGKKFHLMTPRTSLLVLESWHDYQQYGVEMPPDVRQEYEAYLTEQMQPGSEPLEQAVVLSQAPCGGLKESYVYGQILDDHGYPLPGTSITLRSQTGLVMSTTSQANGSFEFSAIPPGNYKITATLEGFTQADQDRLRVTDSNSTYLRFILRPALVEETIMVAAEAAPIQIRQSSTTFDGLSRDSLFSYDGFDRDFYEPAMGVELDALNGLEKENRRLQYTILRKHFGYSTKFYQNAYSIFQSSDPEFAWRVLMDLIEHRGLNVDSIGILLEKSEFRDNGAILEALFDRAEEMSIDDDQVWFVFGTNFVRARKIADAEKCLGKMEDANLQDELFKRIYPESAPMNQEIPSPETEPDSDLRIVLIWDHNFTDLDLHVTEPSGEEAYYKNPKSSAGGVLSKDVTTGYGPEIYTIAYAPTGEYKIDVVNYANRGSIRAGTYALVTIYHKDNSGQILQNQFTISLTTAGERKTVTSIHID